jgi:hypothetical protein
MLTLTVAGALLMAAGDPLVLGAAGLSQVTLSATATLLLAAVVLAALGTIVLVAAAALMSAGSLLRVAAGA